MKINWNEHASIDNANKVNTNTIMEHLDIQFTEMNETSITATMPVDKRTYQPFGLLHGGASCVLSETLGSSASAMSIDILKQTPVGLEITTSHLRSVRSGKVTGICKAIKLGRKIHLWETKIYDEHNNLLSISKLTVMILDRKPHEQ